MKRWLASVLLALSGLVLWASGQAGSAPQITLLDFPKEIKADGTPVSGFIFFKDPDGDVVRAEFLVVQATDFQPFSLDLKVKGAKEGVIEFQISTKTPQRVVLRAVLVDEAGNRSAPWEFAFEAVGPAILRVSPTSLSFSSEVGRNPASQTVQITNAGTGTLNWNATADQPWINLNPASGTAPSTITVSLNAVSLAAGSYSGRITISAPEAQGSPTIVIVTLSLGAAGGQYTVCPTGCPFSSIRAAVEAARAGETITIGPGTYPENLMITKTLTLRGAGQDQTVLKGVDPGKPVIRVESPQSIEITIHNLTVTGARMFNSSRDCAVAAPQWLCPDGIQLWGNVKATITSVQSSSNRNSGVTAAKNAQVTIQTSTFSDNEGDGLHLVDSARATVQDTQVFGNNDDGVQVSEDAVLEIKNSVIRDNRGNLPGKFSEGLYITGTAQVTAQGITITGNGDDGIDIGDSARLDMRDSIVQSNNDSGIVVRDRVRVTIAQSRILTNRGWGIIAELKKCGYDKDSFTGQVILRDNEITRNQKGQVCLP